MSEARGKRSVAAMLVASLLGCSAVSAAEFATLRVGYFELPPHTGSEGQSTLESPAYRHFSRIAARMGVERIELQKLPLARLLVMLERGEIDAALMLARSPDREQALVYPSKPFFVARPVVVFSIANAETRNIGGYGTAFRLGVWHKGYIGSDVPRFRVMAERLSGDSVTRRHLHMLQLGRIDAFYSPDGCAASYALATAPFASTLRTARLTGQTVPLYTVFSPVAAGQWLNSYERALAAVGGSSAYGREVSNLCRGDGAAAS